MSAVSQVMKFHRLAFHPPYFWRKINIRVQSWSALKYCTDKVSELVSGVSAASFHHSEILILIYIEAGQDGYKVRAVSR